MKNKLYDVIQKTKKLGADYVDILFTHTSTLMVDSRHAKLENVVQAERISAHMQVSVGNCRTVVSTDNTDILFSENFREKALFAAQNSPEEEELIRAKIHCSDPIDLDLDDAQTVTAQQLENIAVECDDLASQVPGIFNVEGASATREKSHKILIRDSDFCGEYYRTFNEIAVIPIAKQNDHMVQDYDFSCAVHRADLRSTSDIAYTATQRALKKLGARKINSCKLPVVFDRRVASEFLGEFLAAANGENIAKNSSFLLGKLNQQIFSQHLTICDDSAIKRGIRSRPFDIDGVSACANTLVQDGFLRSFLLNTKYATKLQMHTTGHAASFESIAPTNAWIFNGKTSVAQMLKNLDKCLLVTEVFGSGFNIVTGDYSCGVFGFWVENGQPQYPVHEITIAGDFFTMAKECMPANDLIQEKGVDSPSLYMGEMTVGGI